MEEFDIEFVKLKNGIHRFEYQINRSFFDFFKNQEIIAADVQVLAVLNKLDNMIQVDIDGLGTLGFTCDRCLGGVNYPVKSQFKVIYHLNSVENKTDEATEVNLDIMYLSGSQFKLNIGESVYQSFLSTIPFVKRCDDVEGQKCNEEMLKRLDSLEDSKESTNETDPRWEELKKLLNKKEK